MQIGIIPLCFLPLKKISHHISPLLEIVNPTELKHYQEKEWGEKYFT
jgi:hypothetical protein